MEKKSMSVPEMRAMLGIGKTESYWLVKKHYFRTVIANGKMRVMLDSFESWYENQVRYKKVNGEPPGANWRHTYSVQEAADILGISDSTVYDLMRKDLFTLYQVGGFRRIDKESFEKWYTSQNHYKKRRKEVDTDGRKSE